MCCWLPFLRGLPATKRSRSPAQRSLSVSVGRGVISLVLLLFASCPMLPGQHCWSPASLFPSLPLGGIAVLWLAGCLGSPTASLGLLRGTCEQGCALTPRRRGTRSSGDLLEASVRMGMSVGALALAVLFSSWSCYVCSVPTGPNSPGAGDLRTAPQDTAACHRPAPDARRGSLAAGNELGGGGCFPPWAVLWLWKPLPQCLPSLGAPWQARQRRAELQKARVMQSYYEAKARREKKIKSKK